MGRGRQKAKHQKVARQLKYHTSTIDVSALERELAGEQIDHEYNGDDDGDAEYDDDPAYGEGDPEDAYGSDSDFDDDDEDDERR